MPPSGRDPGLDMYIEMVKEDIIDGINRNNRDNLYKEERQALRDLSKDDTIVIRPADKGSGVATMNKQDYINKVKDDLNNNTTYKKVNKDILTMVNNKVKKLVKNLHCNGHIDDKTKKYMLPTNPGYGKVKVNPKVHKTDNPIRTIISTINSPTEKLTEVAESELSEWVESLDTYVKDTTHFLWILQNKVGKIPDSAILFTMDVKVLYPSIPRKEGLQACRLALENRKRRTFQWVHSLA